MKNLLNINVMVIMGLYTLVLTDLFLGKNDQHYAYTHLEFFKASQLPGSDHDLLELVASLCQHNKGLLESTHCSLD